MHNARPPWDMVPGHNLGTRTRRRFAAGFLRIGWFAVGAAGRLCTDSAEFVELATRVAGHPPPAGLFDDLDRDKTPVGFGPPRDYPNGVDGWH